MKNKLIYGLLALLIFSLLPTAIVSAENVNKTEKENKAAISTQNTTAADLQAFIEQLQNQIKELQDQLAKLKSEVAEVKEELQITKNLRKGLSDGEVKKLQKFLSQFHEIYPEGLITGYFGSLTEKAIKKFQEKYDIPATGLVDPLTRGKINEFLAEEAKEEKLTICHIPLGNLAAKHTLTIGKLALEAHLAHGDAPGACEAQPTVVTPVPESAPAKPAAVSDKSGTPTIPTVTAPAAVSVESGTPTIPAITATITPISASSVTQFVNSGEYAYGVTTKGSVLCWSLQPSGEITLPDSGAPVLCTLKDIARIAPGGSHTCAVKTDGSAICWGNNQFGQLGNGTYSDLENKEISTPMPVLGLGPGTTADITVGANHTCALKKDGSVFCWGMNVSTGASGMLGDGTNEPVRLIPTQVAGLGAGTVSALFPDRASSTGTCALKTNGAVVCWGETSPIGYYEHFTPVAVPDLIPGTVKYLSILHKGYCVLKTDDSVICTGRNLEGQLGGKVKISNSIFTQVSGLTKGTTAAISPGLQHTCALKKDGSVICWGNNNSGQLGDGTVFFKYTPVSVIGLGAGTTAAISVNNDFSSGPTCALKTDGLVMCWPGRGKTTEGKSTRAPAFVPLIRR